MKDCSALVTAVLLALALPPYTPWWITVVGSASAIILAKQLYGGLGYNPFNPAMVGYVVLLISFPVEMTRWGLPQDLTVNQTLPTLFESLQWVFIGSSDSIAIDNFTGATPLDYFKNQQGMTTAEIYASTPLLQQGLLAGVAWEWVNIGFLAGGLVLLYKKIFTWHAPIAMLTTLTVLSAIGYLNGSSDSGGSPLFHLLSGGTMLGAFFIITDPVSSAVSNKGRLIYGASIGLLVYIIRYWGNYPDAIAFAVLLMNFAAPLIDYYTLPRTYGYQRTHSATRRREP